MFEIADDLQFFHEVLLMPMLASLQIILNCNQLADVLSLVNLAKPSLTDQLQFLYVLLSNEKL